MGRISEEDFLRKRIKYRIEFLKRNEEIEALKSAISILSKTKKPGKRDISRKGSTDYRYEMAAEYLQDALDNPRWKGLKYLLVTLSVLSESDHWHKLDVFSKASMMGLPSIEIVHSKEEPITSVFLPLFEKKMPNFKVDPDSISNNMVYVPLAYGVDPRNQSIIIKINLARNKTDIIRDINNLLKAVDEQFTIKRPKIHFEEFDKMLMTYDIKKKNRRMPWKTIAEKVIPKYFSTSDEAAISLVKHYYRRADAMINRLGALKI